jgi:hypothetical protein
VRRHQRPFTESSAWFQSETFLFYFQHLSGTIHHWATKVDPRSDANKEKESSVGAAAMDFDVLFPSSRSGTSEIESGTGRRWTCLPAAGAHCHTTTGYIQKIRASNASQYGNHFEKGEIYEC